jgi:hypothetical protein
LITRRTVVSKSGIASPNKPINAPRAGRAAPRSARRPSSATIGTSVLSNDFRHPVLLASEAATLDLLLFCFSLV